MRPVLMPRLAPMLKMTVAQYIDFWGAELYIDFCRDLGLMPMAYWDWVAHTRAHGVDWWCRGLELRQIKILPPVSDYCMLVRTAHPYEAGGPMRLRYYVTRRIETGKLTAGQVHEMLWNELGGSRDAQWHAGIVAHLDRR